jgi:5-(carboxyamino)imidazole ribonucleotide mutase
MSRPHAESVSAVKALVAIIMGSDSDLPIMREAAEVLKQSGVPYEMSVFSAHRTPGLLRRYLVQAERKGIEVFIAGAGGAAHLPGVIAAHTLLPVIGVPIDSQLKGIDSLLSIVQMPKGIPVATVAIGKAGAANAAIYALEMLRLKYPEIGKALKGLRQSLRSRVLAANRKLRREQNTSGDTIPILGGSGHVPGESPKRSGGKS